MSKFRLRAVTVRFAEACGWLLDVNEKWIDSFLQTRLGRSTPPADVTGIPLDMAPAETSAVGVDVAGASEQADPVRSRQRWTVETTDEFVESLLQLEDRPEIADALVELFIHLEMRAHIGAPLGDSGLHVVRSPATAVKGFVVPAIKLVYTLDAAAHVVYVFAALYENDPLDPILKRRAAFDQDDPRVM